MPDNPIDAIAEDVADGLEAAGVEIVERVQTLLSVPVEYRRGPRGGTIVIRSKPGEPPRKETGRLQAGVTSEVIRNGLAAVLTVEDLVSYALPLQNAMNRPIMTNADEYSDLVLDHVISAINGGGEGDAAGG